MANPFIRSAHKLLFNRRIKGVLERIPYARRVYAGWMRQHPFDARHGIDTSGFVPVEAIHPDPALNKLIIVYAGSQPSIVRRALAALPEPESRTFIDLGCGKGRATIVASELHFKRILGVELSEDLAKTARANMEHVRSKSVGGSPIEIVQGNALKYDFPAGKVVIFMYHPFGRELMTELVRTLEARLNDRFEHLFVVYNNPVHGDLFDGSPGFTRWFAEVLPYDESEVGFGPDLEETVVIWQSARGAIPTPHLRANRPLKVLKPSWTAGLED